MERQLKVWKRVQKPGIVDNKEWICQLDSTAKHWPFMWLIKETIAECWKAPLGQIHTWGHCHLFHWHLLLQVYPGLHRMCKFGLHKILLIEFENQRQKFSYCFNLKHTLHPKFSPSDFVTWEYVDAYFHFKYFPHLL